MTEESSNDSEEFKKAVNKGAKEVKKGLLSAFEKLKQNVAVGMAESSIQDSLNEGDAEKIASSGQILGKAVIKGAAEGLSDVVSGLSLGGNTLLDAMNKVKKQNKESNNDIKDNMDYEIIDE